MKLLYLLSFLWQNNKLKHKIYINSGDCRPFKLRIEHDSGL